MTKLTISRNRLRRSTAGINKYNDEQDYVLVSFPQSNKHSVVPASYIDIDPFDERNGTIETYESRKTLRIIANGSEEQMKERALRYGVSAGSEEVEIIFDQEKNDDDEYIITSSRRTTKRRQIRKQTDIISSKINQPMTRISKKKNSKYMKSSGHLLSKRQLNFTRFYGKNSKIKKINLNNYLDENNIKTCDDNLSIIKKIDELQTLLEISRQQRKKELIKPMMDNEVICHGCIRMNEEIVRLSKRLEQIEELLPTIKEFSPKNSHEKTGIKPDDIKSTTLRPTMIMRELIKKSGHIADKSYFREHQSLFKEFIQVKCNIPDDSLDAVWKEVKDSLARQHLDEESNRKKKIRQEQFTISTNSTVSEPIQIFTDNSNQEKQITPLET